MRERLPLPNRIQDAPQLELGLELFLTAFYDLHSCRAVGFEEGPIRWVDIYEYCSHLGVTGEQEEDLFYHVSALDKVYLDWRESKRSKK